MCSRKRWSEVVAEEKKPSTFTALLEEADALIVDGVRVDLVPAGFACPNCGERVMGLLGLETDGDSDRVTCESCGASYTIGQV